MHDMNKKLLYIVNHMECFWTRRYPIAHQALKNGWDVSVCASGADQDKRLHDLGFRGYALPEPKRKLSAFSMLQIMIEMLRVVRKEKPDIVHVMTLKYAFMAGLALLLYRHNIRIVHTIAGLGYLFSGEGFKPKFLRFLISPFMILAFKNKRTVITFQNPDDQKLMIARGFVDEGRTHLIKGSGIDLNEFAYKPEPTKQPLLVVMPTRLIHEKGIEVFVKAAQILKSKGINAEFQIAGGGAPYNPREILREEMEFMVADGAVEWLGKVSDMPGLLARSNLVVYPSYYGEGIPKVLLEAASIGRAIITTDHPGCREAVKPNENGLLVPIKNVQATAEAIETLLNDEKLRHSMGRDSRKIAEKEFDVRLVVQKTLDIYAALYV